MKTNCSKSKCCVESSTKNHEKTRLRSCEGWKFEWTTPRLDADVIRTIVRGPFLQPKLVKAQPYVVMSECKSCIKSAIPIQHRLRSGIPDPWLEYLASKEDRGNVTKDVRLTREYLRITEYVWNEKGLNMVQGIPDPWKRDSVCTCKELLDIQNKKDIKKKSEEKPKSNKEIKDIVAQVSKGVFTDKPSETIKEVSNKGIKKLSNLKAFDEIKQKLTEIEEELKLKEAEKLALLKVKENKKRNKKSKICRVYHTEGAIQCNDSIVKEISRVDKPIEKNGKDQKVKIQYKQNESLSKDTKNLKSIPNKLENKESSRLQEKNSSKLKACSGSCKRYLEDRKINLQNDEQKKFLQDIKSKIKVTKDTLNSPDFLFTKVKNFNDTSSKEESPRSVQPKILRKRGGGIPEHQPKKNDLLFKPSQRMTSNQNVDSLNNFELLGIPNYDAITDDNSVSLKQRYQKSAGQSTIKSENNDQLIVESYSD